MSSLGSALEPQSDLEKNSLKIKLANAGFRSESAPAIYQGMPRRVALVVFVVPAAADLRAQGRLHRAGAMQYDRDLRRDRLLPAAASSCGTCGRSGRRKSS